MVSFFNKLLTYEAVGLNLNGLQFKLISNESTLLLEGLFEEEVEHSLNRASGRQSTEHRCQIDSTLVSLRPNEDLCSNKA